MMPIRSFEPEQNSKIFEKRENILRTSSDNGNLSIEHSILENLSISALFSPKISDQNFVTAILFSIVKKSSNYASGDDMALHSFLGNRCRLRNVSIVPI